VILVSKLYTNLIKALTKKVGLVQNGAQMRLFKRFIGAGEGFGD
jgi:hypothetical protein